METDELTGVEETDASESSTEEEAPEETEEEYDDLTEEEEEEAEEESEDENKVPQGRFSEVIEERNAERARREQLEKDLEIYKKMIPAKEEPQVQQEPTIDYTQYMNEEGELDLNAYTKAVEGQIAGKLKGEIRQEAEIDKRVAAEEINAKEAYPELAKNERLFNLVKATKTQSLIEGKYTTLIDAADEVFAELGTVREAGAESVRRSEKIQSNAGLVQMGSEETRTTKGTLTNADVATMDLNQYAKAQKSGEIDRAIKAGTLKGYKII